MRVMDMFRRKNQKRGAPANSSFAYWLKSDDNEILPGYTALDKNEAVLLPADVIADLVSNQTIMLLENGQNGDRRLKNELSRKLDVEPCEYMDRKNWLYKIAKDLVVYGNSVVIPHLDEIGIQSLEPVDAKSVSYVDPVTNKRDYGIIYNGVEFKSNEVLHFVLNPDQRRPWIGVGYAKEIKETLGTLAQATATKKAFLKSNWKPSIVISVESDIEELMDKGQRDKILHSYTDTVKEGEPWLIPASEMTVQTVNPLTLNDLSIQDSIKLDKCVIGAAMGHVPKFLLGVGDFNRDEFNNFVQTTIASISQIIAQQLTRKLLYSRQMYFKLNSRSLMQYSMAEHVSFTKEMVAGGMLSRNEGRNEFDYSPVDKEGMDDYIVLENYIPVEKVGDQKKLEGGDSGGSGENGQTG